MPKQQCQNTEGNLHYLQLTKIWSVINSHHFNNYFSDEPMPSVLWHCWLGVKKRESIWPLKNWVMMCWRGFLAGVRCKWFCIWSSWCHCHPIISFFIKIQTGLIFLVTAYPGCPWKQAIKRVCLSRWTWVSQLPPTLIFSNWPAHPSGTDWNRSYGF